uniref:Uncharacterized protein n=2 Tax=Cyprinus carpio TaxID=7962 RepID=A0A8C1MDW6_CYPCA
MVFLCLTLRVKMVLRRLFYVLINNAQVVEKLSESRPIRRAAQITAFAITKAQIAGKEASTKLLRSDTVRQIRDETSKMPRNVEDFGRRATRLRDTFVKEVKEGMRDANRQIKDRNPKMSPKSRVGEVVEQAVLVYKTIMSREEQARPPLQDGVRKKKSLWTF